MDDAAPITIFISDEQHAKGIAHLHKMACDAQDRREPSLVYFIAPVEGGRIKIGITASIEKRLPHLRRMSPVDVDLIACAPGGRDLEAAYHTLFCNERAHGEWFNPSDRLRAECERLASIWIG